MSGRELTHVLSVPLPGVSDAAGGAASVLGVAFSVEPPRLAVAPVELDAPDKVFRNFSFGRGGDLGGDLAIGGGPIGAPVPCAVDVDAGPPGGDFHLLRAGAAPGGDFHLLPGIPSWLLLLLLEAAVGGAFLWVATAASTAGVIAGGGGRLEEQLPFPILAFFLASSPEELDLSAGWSCEESQIELEDLPLVLSGGEGPLV
jgi:hypothetical protein